MIQGYGSLKMTGTNPNKLPDGLGDFLLEQDFIRDKAWLWDRIGALMMDIYGQGSPAGILVSGGVVTDDGSHTKVNISAGVGYAPYTIDLGTSAAIPPATATEDLAPVRVVWGALSSQGNINTANTWYVKMAFSETDWNSRTRAKAGGTWAFSKKPSYTLTINTTAPTSYEILLATIVSTGSAFTSITNAPSMTNTMLGSRALGSNGTGIYNTAIGASALQSNTIGTYNTAVGSNALQANTAGSSNTAVGYTALQANTTGGSNTAVGNGALYNNTTGGQNTAVGSNALQANTAGYNNTAVGNAALQTNATGYNNTAVGNGADVSGQYSYASAFGASASVASSSTVRMGRASTDTLKGYNYTADSDARLKRDIIDIPIGLDFVEKLRPVFFRWKDRKYRHVDPSTKEEKVEELKYHRYHAGFIAQEFGATLKELGIDFGAYQDGAVNAGIKEETKIDFNNFRETEDMKGIAEGQLISVLVKAVQELSAKVEKLEAK